jgi:hypothetical protein
MRRFLRIPAWPLTVTVPLLVAGLMIAVAVVISQIVVSRLVRDQETNLTLLANAYLDGLSAAVLPAVVRGDVWETFDALDRARGQYSGVEARYAIVALPNGSVLAASDPARFPIHSDVPAELRAKSPTEDGLVIDYELIGRGSPEACAPRGFPSVTFSQRSTSPVCCMSAHRSSSRSSS